MIFTFGKYKIDVDVEKTREFYERPTTPCGFCSCADCRNFEEYAKTAPAELRQWFRALGLDICNPGEVLSLFEEQNGLMTYGGWWHLCGKIIKTNTLDKQSENDGYDVAENFKVSFHDNCNCVPHDFPRPVIQMEIRAFIPILLEGCNSTVPVSALKKPVTESKDRLCDFDFHDSIWYLESAENGILSFSADAVNIRKDALTQPSKYDLELHRTEIIFAGVQDFSIENYGMTEVENDISALRDHKLYIMKLTDEAEKISVGTTYFGFSFHYKSVTLKWDHPIRPAWYERKKMQKDHDERNF